MVCGYGVECPCCSELRVLVPPDGGYPATPCKCSFHLGFGLDITNNKLRGGVPLELAAADYRRSLNLSNSQLTGEFPQFDRPSSETGLHINGNQLSGCIPLGLHLTPHSDIGSLEGY